MSEGHPEQTTPKPINPELQKLKEIYNPSSNINIIEQSRIIYDALQPTGDFPRSTKRLAEYLNLSQNKVYKLSYVHEHLISEVKEWLKSTGYQMSTAYAIACKSPEEQKTLLAEYKEATGWNLQPQATASTETS